jgi:hypothetical protein
MHSVYSNGATIKRPESTNKAILFMMRIHKESLNLSAL